MNFIINILAFSRALVWEAKLDLARKVVAKAKVQLMSVCASHFSILCEKAAVLLEEAKAHLACQSLPFGKCALRAVQYCVLVITEKQSEQLRACRASCPATRSFPPSTIAHPPTPLSSFLFRRPRACSASCPEKQLPSLTNCALTHASFFLSFLQAKGVQFILPSDVVVADKFAPDADHKVVDINNIPDGWMVSLLSFVCLSVCLLVLF